jgi:SAM-dependent methyltransferase
MSQAQDGAASAGFSAEWLSLREPFDCVAREAAAAQPQMKARLARLKADGPTSVLDLACGQGANLRVLAPQLGPGQHWRLVDHDPALLAALPLALQHWAKQQGYRYTAGAADCACRIEGPGFLATVEWQRLDLSRDLESIDLTRTTLISASALLDLVSAAWLQRLIERARGAGAAMLWALNIDGRLTWEPPDPDDAAVHALFCAHQHRDKGFGPALGPQAGDFALAQLAQAGYASTVARSDWHMAGEPGAPMQRAMIDGIAAAVLEQDPSMQARVRAWQARRTAGIGHSSLLVGHVDILAMPR